MKKKNVLIYVFLICIILIVFLIITISSKYLKKSKTSSTPPAIEKEETAGTEDKKEEEESQESYDGSEDTCVQLEYPNKVSYPEMKQFDVFISNYPANAAYCKISANSGKTSSNKIYLKKENTITYYFPDNFAYDSILFEFYDENSQLIENSRLSMEYDKDEKLFQIFEVKNNTAN